MAKARRPAKDLQATGVAVDRFQKAVDVLTARVEELIRRIALGQAALMQPASDQSEESIQDRFERLAAEWRAQTGMLSSVTDKAMHPAYQQIVGMGRPVVPSLLRDLARKPDHWFWALRVITGIDPVPPADRGRIKKMAEAWLKWGKAQGLLR